MNSTDPNYTNDHDSSGHLISPDYGYLPIRSVSLMFTILFALTTAIHLWQAFRVRGWWLLFTVILAGGGEVAGWYGREWSHDQPLNDTPYTIQILALILSPTPLVGALFITFGRMAARLGQRYSRLRPRLYSRIFLTIDIICLLVQAGGGSISSGNNDVKVAQIGSDITLGGIIFQLVALTVFGALLVEYLTRRNKDRPFKGRDVNDTERAAMLSGNLGGRSVQIAAKRLAIMLCIATTLLGIRAIYRTVELSDGWNGKIIKTQWLFIVFDGVPVFSTMVLLNIFHPGSLLKALEPIEGVIPLENKA
ncbi:RTA1-domain-containing protein [Cubamyces sp. BRFM 1775]|nr:RTA1-domain-containing protein [Cubamyces sp. BRFM 1775]